MHNLILPLILRRLHVPREKNLGNIIWHILTDSEASGVRWFASIQPCSPLYVGKPGRNRMNPTVSCLCRPRPLPLPLPCEDFLPGMLLARVGNSLRATDMPSSGVCYCCTSDRPDTRCIGLWTNVMDYVDVAAVAGLWLFCCAVSWTERCWRNEPGKCDCSVDMVRLNWHIEELAPPYCSRRRSGWLQL